jgi:hypothetical protein
MLGITRRSFSAREFVRDLANEPRQNDDERCKVKGCDFYLEAELCEGMHITSPGLIVHGSL